MPGGRAAIPTAVKKLRGNPGKHRLNDSEAAARPAKNADPPSYLSESALVIWHELAPELWMTGRLTREDIRSLATGCRFQALGERYLTEYEQAPKPVRVRAGLDLLAAAHRIFCRFGITPSERAQLVVPKSAQPPSKWTGVLSA